MNLSTNSKREAMTKRKVLLMGKSGAGKTSMRSIIFANYIARDCDRLGPTMEIEHAHVRFLGSLVLLLWDCGGQEAFMENYMSSQRDQIFKNVQVLIYVFDVESREIDKDYRYYQGCLEALLQNSPEAKVFCLVHKMDLISEENRDKVFEDKVSDIRRISNATADRLHGNIEIECYRSSIWDETLYKAWSAIVYQLVPNVTIMEQKLRQFAEIMDADEVCLTFPESYSCFFRFCYSRRPLSLLSLRSQGKNIQINTDSKRFLTLLSNSNFRAVEWELSSTRSISKTVNFLLLSIHLRTIPT